MNPVQRYTDMTYGVLLAGALCSLLVFDGQLPIGIGIGVFIGYLVHVGSEMFEYAQMNETVEEVQETVDDLDKQVGSVKETVEDVADDT